MHRFLPIIGAGLLGLFVAVPALTLQANAQGNGLPRFASLKADKVNVRKGPGRDKPLAFVFNRAGLPVEITAKYEHYRRVRDSEGAEGWVFFRLLSRRRTALVVPWEKPTIVVAMYAKPDKASGEIAKLRPKILANIVSCNGNWCLTSVGTFRGWIEQKLLWGVYQNEIVK